jgi:hypothetical protein
MKIPSPRLMALDQFDRHMPHMQLAAAVLRDQMPGGGWVRGIRSLLQMSMRDFGVRIHFRLGSRFHSMPQWQLDMLTGSVERRLKKLWDQ